MTFAELRSKVRAVLQDSNGAYWSDDELDLYLNEAQEEFCRHTRVLRGEHPITTRENQAVYTLPEDCLEVLRVVGKNGAEVEPSHSRSLHGYRLDTTGTGDPTYHYSDLDGDGKMRFYPQPKPTIETGITEFSQTTGYLVDPRLPIGNAKAVVAIEGHIYIADDANIYDYEIDGETLILRDQIAHGVTVTERFFLNPVPSGQSPGSWPALTHAGANDVWVLHDTSIYYWDRALNSMVTFTAGGLTSKVNGVVRFMTSTATVIGWSSVDGNMYYSFNLGLDTFNEVATAADVSSLGIQWSESDGNTARAWIYDDTDTRTERWELYFGGGYTAIWDGNPSWPDPVPVDPRITAAAGFEEINTATITDELWTIDENGNLWLAIGGAVKLAQKITPDLGAIVYWNGSTFDSEYGAMVDLTSDDLVTFDSEQGIVTSFITAEKVATAYYVRKPRQGVVEISDALALVWYAISRAYEQDGEQSHLARAQYYSRKFRDGMGRTKRRVASGYNGNTSPRKGRYY